jgi:uncharacterized membrane protein
VDLGRVGLVLVFAGFLVAVVGVVAAVAYTAFRGASEVGYGGCILVMFVPICFGTGTSGIAPLLVLVSAVAMLVAVLVAYYLLRSVAKPPTTGTYYT